VNRVAHLVTMAVALMKTALHSRLS